VDGVESMKKVLIAGALLLLPATAHAQSAAAALSPNSAPILNCQKSGEQVLLACLAGQRFPVAVPPPGEGAAVVSAGGAASTMTTLVYAFLGLAATAGLIASVGGANADSP